MAPVFAQLFVAILTLIAAGVKNLHFAASSLTEFELDRRIKAGDDSARQERELRQSRPLLDALRRLVVLILTIVIVIVLAGSYSFFAAIIFALVWLLIIEMLSSNVWLGAQTQRLAMRYSPELLKVVQTLRPFLRFWADSRALASPSAAFYSKEELLKELQDSQAVLSKDEKLLLTQALMYRDMLVKDIMTPRSVVVTVQAADTIGPILLDHLHKAGHSRFPVIEDDLDHTKGILYMHDLVPLSPKIKKVADVMSRKVFYVHQDKPLDHVLQAFLRTKHHLFMVANEFEEVTGVISIEDVLEAIIGRKIVDEFDQYEDLRAVAKLAAEERRAAREG